MNWHTHASAADVVEEGRAKSAMARVVVLLPALNEERAIGNVISRIPRKQLKGRGYEVSVWVVDGKSVDGTREVAMNNGAAVFVQRGSGKGNGMQQALHYLLGPVPGGQEDSLDPRYFLMLDSDGTYPPECVPDVLAALEAGYDVVLGSRFLGRIADGAISRLNLLGNRLLTAFARLLYRAPISDVCTGMWGFRESFLRHLALTACGFDLEADIFASACQLRARLAEVPIRYDCRIGEPKLVPIRTGVLIAWRLLVRWLSSSSRPTGIHRQASMPQEQVA